MIDKIRTLITDPISMIPDGASVMVGGFAGAGEPRELIHALCDHGAKDLTIISNSAGTGEVGIPALLRRGLVRKIICSHPRPPNADVFVEAYRRGEVELEIVPQGTLAERIRAAGAGLGAFYTPTGYGTRVAEGKESRVVNGKGYILEEPLSADFALICADQGDRWGNLMYRGAARNFNPVMAMASKMAIAQVQSIVPLGYFTPEYIMTPGVFVDAVVHVGGKND